MSNVRFRNVDERPSKRHLHLQSRFGCTSFPDVFSVFVCRLKMCQKNGSSPVPPSKWSFSTPITIYFAIKQHDKYVHSYTGNTISSRTGVLCLYEQIYVINTDHKTFPLTTILLIRNPLYSRSFVTVLSVCLLFQYKFLEHEAFEGS